MDESARNRMMNERFTGDEVLRKDGHFAGAEVVLN